MAIKDILVFLDDGDTNTDRVKAAISMAKQHEACLSGAALASMKPVHAKIHDEKAIARMGDKLSHKLVEDFSATAAESGLVVKTIIIQGDAPTSALKMAHYARNADLVILSQPNPARDNYTRLQEFARQVLLHSGRPVFFMPYIGANRIPCKKALIAWDGTPAVSRAVHDAIPLLVHTTETLILVVESRKQKQFKQDVLVEGLQGHLDHHGVKTSIVRKNPGNNNVPSVILNQISDNNIDLLVMGGYGTPTLKQKIFGSVSQILLNSMIVPVFMSH